MERQPRLLTIGAFAKAAEVGVETIRYYQRRGLLREPERAPGQVRRYGPADVQRLQFIKAAQRLGFSLDDVAHLLQLEDGTQCAQAQQLAAHKLELVRERLDSLRRIEAALSGLVASCKTHQGDITCPLITALSSQAR
jgi:MerR family mercuric resistance operon transcriptional regulator